jgi:hypothetical protein
MPTSPPLTAAPFPKETSAPSSRFPNMNTDSLIPTDRFLPVLVKQDREIADIQRIHEPVPIPAQQSTRAHLWNNNPK